MFYIFNVLISKKQKRARRRSPCMGADNLSEVKLNNSLFGLGVIGFRDHMPATPRRNLESTCARDRICKNMRKKSLKLQLAPLLRAARITPPSPRYGLIY